MKTIKYVILGCAALLLATSCAKDLLDTVPYSALASSSMWTDEALTDEGVVGVYNILRQDYIAGFPCMVESWGFSADDRDPDYPINDAKATKESAMFLNYWKQHYYGVFRANNAIANIPASPTDDAKKARLIAECRFLRAFFYYKLNMVFKGVPIYDLPTEIQDMTKPRNTEQEVWDFVIKDLQACISESNLPDRYEKGNANYGRATKGAAQALLGKVYLWTQNWTGAETAFRAVGAMGYKLFEDEGANSYKLLFKEENEQCLEMIFSVQEIGLSGYGQSMSFRYGGRTSYGSCWNTYMPNTDFVDTYENKDGSKFSWNNIIPGYTSMVPADRKVYFYRDLTEVEPYKDASGASAYNTLVEENGKAGTPYLAEGNIARIRQAYDNRDPRLDMTVITPYSTYLGSVSSIDHTYTLRWPCWNSDATEPFDLRTDTPTRFHYLFRKFVAEGSSEIPNREYSPIDLPVIRYADVLLGLAEALNEQGKWQEAMAEVNKIRKRAGVAELNGNGYAGATVSDQADMRERIRNERRWEFAGEGVTFYDEMRWKTLYQTKFRSGAESGMKEIWGTSYYRTEWGGDHYYTWPIPSAEIQMIPVLTQNSGW
ncbi:MAG: RagB/SusD family nutrient uptake outer membrane protein [Bacteroidales bacterium]